MAWGWKDKTADEFVRAVAGAAEQDAGGGRCRRPNSSASPERARAALRCNERIV